MKTNGLKPNMKFWGCSFFSFHVIFAQAGPKKQFINELITSISMVFSPKLPIHKAIHRGHNLQVDFSSNVTPSTLSPTCQVVPTDGGQSTLRLPPCGLFLGKIWVGWIEI